MIILIVNGGVPKPRGGGGNDPTTEALGFKSALPPWKHQVSRNSIVLVACSIDY